MTLAIVKEWLFARNVIQAPFVLAATFSLNAN